MELTSCRSGARVQTIVDPSVTDEEDTGVYVRSAPDARADKLGRDAVKSTYSPVNVWEFEYPWLEYRRPRLGLLGWLLLVSLGLAAHLHRAELHRYWAASLEGWPKLRAARSALGLLWTQCQPLLAQAWDQYF